jgi:hypothetical protein
LTKPGRALRHYFLSCGLLLVPVFIWNAALARFLPGAWSAHEFWRDIPASLAFAENSLRLIVSGLPFLMPLELNSLNKRRGLIVYGVGSGLYYASWLAILLAPDSAWAASSAGFLAPAYTPLVWLVGLALLGQRLYWGRFYRWWMYLIPAGMFTAAHVGHAALVYARSH